MSRGTEGGREVQGRGWCERGTEGEGGAGEWVSRGTEGEGGAGERVE